MGQRHPRILVVDDDPAIVRVLSAYLESGGYKVYSANRGRHALELIQEQQLSYVITDWNMPNMDGLELCRRIRRLDLPHYVYIVVLTGRSGEDDLIAAMDAGADDFLIKPLHKQTLLARLKAGMRIVQLESRLSQLAAYDELTELLLRRPFHSLLEKEWHRSRRYRAPLSVVMLDVDFFKQVNDTYGHPAGDEVIRKIARLIRENVRKSDIVCRYGGEEFCVMLPETNEASATQLTERLRYHIARETIPIGTTNLRVTVSLGVAEILADMEDKDALLALADQCLLAAKEQGRNRVVALRALLESDSLARNGVPTNCGIHSVSARDAMIPLFHSIHADWPLARAAAYFLQYRVSSVPVTGGDGNLLGVVSEKDVLAIAHAADAPRRRVADVMRSNIITYDECTPLSKVLSFLTRASMRSVVITSAGKPSGLISRAALVRWLLENDWKERRSAGEQRGGDRCVDGLEFTRRRMANQLVTEAGQLQQHLESPGEVDDAAPVIGGATRMQQLIEDLLASSARGNQGGGLPF